MRGIIMGCVCACCAGAAALYGSGPDAEAIVHKSPAIVYSAMESSFANIEQSTEFPKGPDGEDVDFEVTVEREPSKRLQATLLLDGEEAGSIEYTFSAEDEGKSTRMTGEIDIDQAVLKKYLNEGENEDIGRIPEFAFDMAMKASLAGAAEKIEQGLPLDSPSSSLASLRHGQDSPDKSEREYAAMRAQHEATAPNASNRPMVDPDAAARQYMQGGSN